MASEAKNVREAFKSLATNYVFKDKSTITVELVGEKVITGLLDLFIEAVTSNKRSDNRTKQGKLYSLISSNYRFIAEQYPCARDEDGEPSLYDRLMLLTDFVCGMTDSYALDLYRKLTGVKL